MNTTAEMMQRRLSDKNGVGLVGWNGSRMDEYRARIAPIIKLMAGIEAFRPPRSVLLGPDGNLKLGPEASLPPDAEATLAELRSQVESIARELFQNVASESQKA